MICPASLITGHIAADLVLSIALRAAVWVSENIITRIDRALLQCEPGFATPSVASSMTHIPFKPDPLISVVINAKEA